MAKIPTNSAKLTRSDKAHQKFMDKLNAVKNAGEKGMDSIGMIHKQTVDASNEYAKTVAASQESERTSLYDIISTSKDNELIKWAQNRLRELDRNQEEAQNQHDLFLKDERETSNKNIVGTFLCILAAGGFVVGNKQIRQVAKNTLNLLSKK